MQAKYLCAPLFVRLCVCGPLFALRLVVCVRVRVRVSVCVTLSLLAIFATLLSPSLPHSCIAVRLYPDLIPMCGPIL